MPEYLAPGVYMEETSFRSKSIQGVGTSTTAFVGPTRKGPQGVSSDVLTSPGEFERIYGGVTNLQFEGARETPNYLGHAVRAYFNNGGARPYVVRTFTEVDGKSSQARTSDLVAEGGGTAHFSARWPGSGYNGTIFAFEKRTPATRKTLATARIGALALRATTLGGEGTAATPAIPAVLTGGLLPIALADEDKLRLKINNSQKTATFSTLTNAQVVGGEVTFPIENPAVTALVVTIGEDEQTISIDAGTYSELAPIVRQLNAGIRGGFVGLEDDDKITIGTDATGEGVLLHVAAMPLLGFASVDDEGSGNVADIGAVTAEEIAAQFDGILGSGAIDENLVLTTEATGESAEISVMNFGAFLKFGLEVRTVNGEDATGGTVGTTTDLFHKTGDGWKDKDGAAVTPENLPTDIQLVQINLSIEHPNEAPLIHEGLGFFKGHPRYIGDALPKTPLTESAGLASPIYFETVGAFTGFDLYNSLLGSAESGSRELELAGGLDGAVPVVTDDGEDIVSYSDALIVLDDIDDVAIVAAPGHSALAESTFRGVQNALISHVEKNKYRVAVLDTPPDGLPKDAREVRSYIDSKYAALYYPWVRVPNPLARPGNDTIASEITLPPSGFVCGIYARNDIERGVWKAPANEVVRGALGFEREINKGQQEVLNPEGINCLRYFFGRGNRVWGARTVSSDPEWMYINVRRYFIYLEHSIDRSTQWAVFEPNGERLWSNIRDTVTSFLFNEWRSGALLGSSPDQAYFVRCDRSTMTQADLDNGRLVCEIGVAVLKPAEYVIFRIGQKTADAQ